ncbi:NAD-dependent epimerase/dehydratase family protein [Mucilaginibacter psychrotolerans]|uniref:SDR family oxidoreductase n=1 Tax=Mucilaginibacter psychrotolerans TaxID=1524096 RepID=A0A4Y8SPX5_9SPHI|nr:SDR family oxidoreductase [Mucilaginibacter psychrotolerans]TFF40872.1 SDR family oxidoreductase [Mucilaginibacter psychrotolerans]
MKILVIGSMGFIGKACADFLRKQHGADVYGADVTAVYDDDKYFLIDASNADFKQIFGEHQFDWCINCAGAASVPDSFKHPLRDYLLNVQLVVTLLNAIKDDAPTCKFIQLSSAAVYGNPQALPITEAHTLAPLSPYGIHKKQAEELCALYHQYFGLETYVLRLFSAYGRGLKKQLFWDLHKKSVATDNLTLFGTGNETREFIHVLDIANAVWVLIAYQQPKQRIFNVANSSATTIKYAAESFLQNIEFGGTLNFSGQNREGDPLYWQADTTLLNNLGYHQTISFEDGLTDYCNWLKE